MTETAAQLLGHAVPVCQWNLQNSANQTTTAAYPRFPVNVREWIGFAQNVRMQNPLPAGQYQVGFTSGVLIRVKEEAKARLYSNVIVPLEALLIPQGAAFLATPVGFLGASDYVLCTNNFSVAKMPVELKTRHNLNLCDYHLWQIYRYKDRRGIINPDFSNQNQRYNPNFKFKKRILSQIFGQMACNGIHYGILSNYSDTYFLKREETDPNTLYVSRVVQPADVNPTLRQCFYYISQLVNNDNVGNRLGRVVLDNFSSDNDDDEDDSDDDDDDADDPNDPDYDDNDSSSGKRKRKQIPSAKTSSKKSRKTIASSSKVIATVDEYIGGGSFGKIFSGYYDNQAVAWKTCDACKQKEEMKTLIHEAQIYSILKECQGRVVPCLFYKGYIYDGYLFALAMQLIEDSRHIDPTRLTKEEKSFIVNQLREIHKFGVLHNDIATRNILYEPKSRNYFFIDFGLSVIVDNESPKLGKEERRLKKLLQL
ncbi:kinase-like domain-containing protein [Rhizophagus irregularis DAOM 181602=DAOM 197198]|uniref:Protein kinase domain-containing protein n=2 Tax=Rhizophagus irregularis TaxID=588596 RepID=A0A015M7K9_RHIIW|nr:hypothetical protein RirG_157950 [Rhizophagus irregularis DAOM 197198w]GBC24026.1 kinase-like domain-containing protein [Rhizophagus irregularis DAOM 181602=DAOM 197198]